MASAVAGSGTYHGHRPRHGHDQHPVPLLTATGGNAGTTSIAFAAGVPSM